MISREDVIFEINEDKGVVVARPRNKFIVSRILNGMINSNKLICIDVPWLISSSQKSSYKEYKRKIESTPVVGKAKCFLEKDTFDEEKGKEIAFLRLKEKITRYCNRLFGALYRDIEKDLKLLEEEWKNVSETWTRIDAKLQKYV